MSPPECGVDVAAYALGALPPDEARRFERHAAGCELCAADLEALRPAVEALPRSVEHVEPPPELRKRIMSVVEGEARERRAAQAPARRRWLAWKPLPALAAACVLLVAGIGLGVALTGDDTRRFPGTAPAGVQAAVEIEGDDGRLVVDGMPQPPVGRVYQVWLQRGERPPEPTDALFTVREGHASVAVPGRLDGVTTVLVTDEPRGGSAAPTTSPDIRVSL